MDKKNFLIGIGLLILAFFLMIQQGKDQQLEAEKRVATEANASKQPENEKRVVAEANASRKETVPDSTSGDGNSEINASKGTTTPPPSSTEKPPVPGLVLGKKDHLDIFFTNHGGGIRKIHLNSTDRVKLEYDFEYPLAPALDIGFENRDGGPTELEKRFFDKNAYEIVEGQRDSSHMVWENVSADNIVVRREYWRVAGEDYLIHHRTTVTNHAADPLVLERVRLQVGSAQPIDRLYNLFDDSRTYLNVGYYNAGEELQVGCRCANCSGRIDGVEDEFWQINEFDDPEPSFKLSQAKWACVNNRFFANIIRPVKEPEDVEIKGKEIDLHKISGFEEKYDSGKKGISGSFAFPFGSIGPGESRSLEIEYYAGPKDYNRLQELGHEQKTVMQFGIFWWVSEPLNAFLNWLHGWLGNFGLAIIVMTICVKLALWPLTAKSIRSQKKMKELQEPMQALKEKYKGNPQKLNQEMMKFYKEQGVNPLAGCWPMLIQMPIFLGLFWMLRSAAELRGAEFLWIEDLSEQDNLAFLGSYSLNLLPLFMVVTQVIQMKLTPMNLGAGASEQQRIQAKMMRMMPYFFLLFLYFFSSALVLYWTVQNILSIIQTLVTKRGDAPIATTDTAKEVADKPKALDSNQHMSPEEREHRRALGLRLRGELTKKEIKVAFKNRVARYHPDKIRNLRPKRQREAEAKRQKLEKAYEFLLK